MSYLLEPWQMHAARPGDCVIVRHMPVWDHEGWTVLRFAGGAWHNAGLGVFPWHESAERAALAHLSPALYPSA